MKTLTGFFLLLVLLFSTSISKKTTAPSTSLSAPGGQVRVECMLKGDGTPAYTVFLGKQMLVDTSSLGFTLKNAPALRSGFEIVDVQHTTFDETWTPVWGERNRIRNQYREMTVFLREKTGAQRRMNLIFRAYNDGVAFRYAIPEQTGISRAFVIMEEHTEFRLTGDHTALWEPADVDSYEYLYEKTRISEIDAS